MKRAISGRVALVLLAMLPTPSVTAEKLCLTLETAKTGELLLAAASSSVAEEREEAIATFSLAEVFGVSHPDQIVDFDLTTPFDPGSARMLGPNEDEVPYQVLRDRRVAVETPVGSVTPPPRTYDAQGGRAPDKKELPSAGTVFSIEPGINRLGFTGQWLIDWDLYILADEPQQAYVGNWAHYWHPGPEQVEFQRAQGREFEERQHILRIRGNGMLQTLILPRRKGEPREGDRVTREGDCIRIVSGTRETILRKDFYAFSQGHRQGLASFAAGRVELNDLAAEGGAVELIVEGARAVATVHGEKGVRRVVLPGGWKIQSSAGLQKDPVFDSGVWILDYDAVTPATITFSRETQSEE